MLSIAAFAIQSASMAETAPAEFYAGMLTAVNGRVEEDTGMKDMMA